MIDQKGTSPSVKNVSKLKGLLKNSRSIVNDKNPMPDTMAQQNNTTAPKPLTPSLQNF